MMTASSPAPSNNFYLAYDCESWYYYNKYMMMMMMVDDDYNNNNGDDGGGGLTMDGYYYDIADESGNTDDTDTELFGGIFILIKVLELWLGISVIFFIIATVRFYIALYQLGMRTNGFQVTLKEWRRWILLKWLPTW